MATNLMNILVCTGDYPATVSLELMVTAPTSCNTYKCDTEPSIAYQFQLFSWFNLAFIQCGPLTTSRKRQKVGSCQQDTLSHSIFRISSLVTRFSRLY
jgi:hypothetical protein